VTNAEHAPVPSPPSLWGLLLAAFASACAGHNAEEAATADSAAPGAGPAPAASVDPRPALAAPPLLLLLRKGAEEDALLLVSANDRKVAAKLPTGDDPHEVLVTKDGSRAYISDYGPKEAPGKTLTVVDLKTQKVVKTIDLGELRRPHGLAEADGKIYFTAEVSQSVARYDPATDKVDWTAKVGQKVTHMLVVTPDGKKVYTADVLSDSVSAVDVATGQSTPIAVGKQPEGIAISPSGHEVWAAHRGDGSVSVIDTATNKVVATLPCGKLPIRAAFTPDGARVLVSDPVGGEVVVFDAKTREVAKRVPVDGGAMAIAVSPDSKRAFVVEIEAGRVVAIDLVRGEAEPRAIVESIGPVPDGVAWVP
jgi:YVTN family beta-propeller protein